MTLKGTKAKEKYLHFIKMGEEVLKINKQLIEIDKKEGNQEVIIAGQGGSPKE